MDRRDDGTFGIFFFFCHRHERAFVSQSTAV